MTYKLTVHGHGRFSKWPVIVVLYCDQKIRDEIIAAMQAKDCDAVVFGDSCICKKDISYIDWEKQ